MLFVCLFVCLFVFCIIETLRCWPCLCLACVTTWITEEQPTLSKFLRWVPAAADHILSTLLLSFRTGFPYSLAFPSDYAWRLKAMFYFSRPIGVHSGRFVQLWRFSHGGEMKWCHFEKLKPRIDKWQACRFSSISIQYPDVCSQRFEKVKQISKHLESQKTKCTKLQWKMEREVSCICRINHILGDFLSRFWRFLLLKD